MTKKLLSLFAVFIIASIYTLCYSQIVKFTPLHNSENSIYSSPNCFTQDRIGFIWIGYESGFSRYDGYGYQFYNIENLAGLQTNSIRSMEADNNGNILLGTAIGLFSYNSRSSLISSIDLKLSHSPYINDIISIGSATYVASESGLHILKNNIQDSSHINYYSNQKKYHLDNVNKLSKDVNNNLFITNDDGVLVYDNKEKEIRLLYSLSDISGIAHRYIEKRNQLILTTKEELHILSLDDSFNVTDSIIINLNNNRDIITNISTLTIDKYNNIWLGTSGDGIYILDINNNITHHQNDTEYSKSLDNNYVRCIFTDKNGDIIIGTDAGVSIVHQQTIFSELPLLNDGKLKNVHSIYEDKSGILLIGTKGSGLFIINSKTDKTNIINDSNFNTVRSIVRCKNGDLFIGTGGNGLILAEIDSVNTDIKIVKKFKHDPNNPHSIPNNYIYSIKEDNNGDLWVGTNDGLGRIIKDERENEGYRSLNYYHDKNNFNSVNSNTIYSLYIDTLGSIWYGTLYKGFGKIQMKEIPGEHTFDILKDYSPIFLNFKTKMYSGSISLSAYTFAEDKYKNLWIGTDNGLIYKKYNSSSYNIYTTKDGLANNSIYASVIDSNNKLWLSSSDGINSLDLKTFKIKRFYKEDGLQSNEFNGNAYYLTKNGHLYFGGKNGINIINTNKEYQKSIKNNIAISNVEISNKVTPTVKSNIGLGKLSYTDSLIVEPQNNSFNISVTSLNYINPTKTLYKYQLIGNSDEWVNNGYSNNIYINSLPSGKYTLNISCTDSNGDWIKEPKSLFIRVKPPIYRSAIAIILYILIGLSIILFTWYEYKTRVKLLTMIEETKKGKENIEESLIFFTNILHELRSSLALIISPIESILKYGKLNYDYQSKLSLTYRNAKRLSSLTEEMLAIRKLNRQEMALNVESINIIEFVSSITSSFVDYVNTKGINLNFKSSINEIECWVDPSKLEKMIYNLITNAIKFTKRGGSINVTVETLIDKGIEYISINVEDNGIGIDKNELPKIFDRFYQVRKDIGGTGIGLHLTKHFTELHNGRLEATSKLGKGSKFSIVIPTQINKPHIIEENTSIGSEIIEQYKLQSSVKEHIKPDIAHNNIKKLTILVVEDSLELLTYICSNLESDFNVLRADNGQDGLKYATKHRPEIIITDIEIPEINGIELCSKIKANTTAKPYIIVLSATDSNKEKESSLSAGGDIFISKPFDMDYLLQVIYLAQKKYYNQADVISNETNLVYDNNISSIIDDIAITSQEKIFIEKFNSFIHENIMNEELSVELFAESMQMSRSNFYRIIKKITGKSPNAIILWTRMAIAADLLVLNTLSISEISYKVGFSDPKYFTKVFKKHYQKTPSEYAQMFAKKNNLQ